ncbi:putative phosphatidyl transferase, inner membrane domain protein [Vibrio parahaemolyticus EKP-026]|nr:putative phosphatidyl transferase, inner membrane domain protein [Vibrio parahaemolyticus EKP-026]
MPDATTLFGHCIHLRCGMLVYHIHANLLWVSYAQRPLTPLRNVRILEKKHH